MSIIRDVTIQAQNYLDQDEILLFIGARQAGKTTILKQLQAHLEADAKSVYFINLEDPDYLSLLNQSPKNLFKIFTLDPEIRNYILIDEVQYLKNPTNFLKYLYDEYQGKLKLLVSGSSAFYLDKKFKDSLVGRKKIFTVLTLNFREFLRFKNETDLAQKDFLNLSIFDTEKISIYYHEYLIYGGYPRVVLAPHEEKSDLLQEIAYSYIKKDIYEANIRQDELFFKLLKILSMQIGNLVNASELASTLGVTKTTIDNYLYVLQKSFYIYLMRPFYRNIRKELTKMPKVYFLDLGLRNFFTKGFVSFSMRDDRGQLLENAVWRQLMEKHDLQTLKFWRTIDKHEVDFVVNEAEAYEVKASIGSFKEREYQMFINHYPQIDLKVVSLDMTKQKVGQHQAVEVWQIE